MKPFIRFSFRKSNEDGIVNIHNQEIIYRVPNGSTIVKLTPFNISILDTKSN